MCHIVFQANERLTATVGAANATWMAQPPAERSDAGSIHALIGQLRKEEQKINIDLAAGIEASLRIHLMPMHAVLCCVIAPRRSC